MQRRHAGARTPGARFIDPKVLARIDTLDLVAKTVVDGFVQGLHRSPFLGFSLDFAEHRQYEPGDDIRRIDWKLWARTDRYYIKQFEAETNADLSIVLDVSGSMGFGSSEVTKLDYGRFLAASLAYFSIRQRDRVGLVTFDDDVVEYIPPSGKHLDLILHALHRSETGRPGSYEAPLRKAGETFRRRGLVVLISDFYAEPDDVVAAATGLRSSGSDLVIFHLLDPAELEFPFDRASTFEDMESGVQLPVVPDHFREQYRELIQAHTAELDRLFGRRGMDYVLLDTSKPLDEALFRYLSFRERMARVR